MYRWLQLKREKGDVSPLPHGGGQRPRVAPDKHELLRSLVQRVPDATLAELADAFAAETGIKPSVPTMFRTLDRLGLSRKKSR